jgi:hypothetical protein
MVEDTHIFSPTLVNSVRFGWYQPIVVDGGTVDGYTPITGDAVVKELGIQGVNPQGLSGMGFPAMNITGYQPLRVNPAGSPLQNDTLKTITDAATWSKGSHTLKFGGELRLSSNLANQIPEGSFGVFNFTGLVCHSPGSLNGVHGRRCVPAFAPAHTTKPVSRCHERERCQLAAADQRGPGGRRWPAASTNHPVNIGASLKSHQYDETKNSPVAGAFSYPRQL